MGGTVRVDPLEEFKCSVHELRRRYEDSSQPEHSPFPYDERRGIVPVCADDTVHFGPVLIVRGLVLRFIQLTMEGTSDSCSCVAVYGYREGPSRQLTDGSWSVRVRPFRDTNIEEDGDSQVMRAVRAASLRPDSYNDCDVLRLFDLGKGQVDWYSCDPLIDFIETPEQAKS